MKLYEFKFDINNTSLHQFAIMHKFFILFCFLPLTFLSVKAQNSILSVKVTGTVFTQDSSASKPLPYVNIVRKGRVNGTVSDINGTFSIYMLRGDTLLFSYVGYKTSVFILPGDYNERKLDIQIVMKSLTVQLKEVNIISQSLPKIGPLYKKPKTVFIPSVKGSSLYRGFGSPNTTDFSPITLLYNRFSRYGKNQRKLAKWMEADNKEAAYKARLNPEYVSELTGLQGPELDDFMLYCHPPLQFILTAEEYDVVVSVLDCFKTFKRRENYFQKPD